MSASSNTYNPWLKTLGVIGFSASYQNSRSQYRNQCTSLAWLTLLEFSSLERYISAFRESLPTVEHLCYTNSMPLFPGTRLVVDQIYRRWVIMLMNPKQKYQTLEFTVVEVLQLAVEIRVIKTEPDRTQVKAVYKPELVHLIDVVVFPSRGQIPLASKLQGGDYDGDKVSGSAYALCLGETKFDQFWVCWDKAVVESFRNAPAPIADAAQPEQFGIMVNRTAVKDVVDWHAKEPLKKFLHQMLNFGMQPSMLGYVTNFFGKVCYAENRKSSPSIDRLADLHDLLADASKHGYSFDSTAWSNFLKSLGPFLPPRLDVPAYHQITKTSLLRSYSTGPRYNPAHVVDHLLFDVALVHARRILSDIRSLNTLAAFDDQDLTKAFRAMSSCNEVAFERICRKLHDDIREVFKRHSQIAVATRGFFKQSRISIDAEPESRLQKLEATTIQQYRQIEPLMQYRHALESKGWFRTLVDRPSDWDLLKASALSSTINQKLGWSNRTKQFMVQSDLHNICYIKAHSGSGGRPFTTVPSIHRALTMKKSRIHVGSKSFGDEAPSDVTRFSPTCVGVPYLRDHDDDDDDDDNGDNDDDDGGYDTEMDDSGGEGTQYHDAVTEL